VFETFIMWKVCWSRNNYSGWDHESYKEWIMGKDRRFSFVKTHGFGHEWWNFYEGFHRNYYFGYASPVYSLKPRKLIAGGIIYFISRHPWSGEWFLVGVYGGVRILKWNPWISGPLINYVPRECHRELLDVTLKELKSAESTQYYLIMAEKNLSTSLPRPVLLQCLGSPGIKTRGRWFYRYLTRDQGMNILDAIIEYIEHLKEAGKVRNTSSLVSVALRLKNLKNHANTLLQHL